MKNLPLKILHFALDTLYEIKLWCYAIINKVVPVAPRDDFSNSKDGNWLIEFSAPAEIQRRRKKLLSCCHRFLFLSKKHRYYYGNNSFDYNTCQERRIVPVSPPFHQSSDRLPFFPRRLHIFPIYIAVRILRLAENLPPFGFCQFLSRICAFCQLLDSFHTLTSSRGCCYLPAVL